MSDKIKNAKNNFRRYQKGLSVEEKINQLYLMQIRYLQISRNAIEQGLKKKTFEYERACRLAGEKII